MKKRSGYNPKRELAPADVITSEERHGLATRVIYKGNPQHKKYPNDYGLTPPSAPRSGKTLCDADGEFPKVNAEALLKAGVEKGMISVQRRNGWPQNIWAVDDGGQPFEAQLESREQGHYHGYPMPADDPFREIVTAKWRQR